MSQLSFETIPQIALQLRILYEFESNNEVIVYIVISLHHMDALTSVAHLHIYIPKYIRCRHFR